MIWAITIAALCSGALGSAPPESVVRGPHNLSAGGRGQVTAAGESQVCIFCHTSHTAAPITSLWNRNMRVDGYSIYQSRSLDALPGQPTGSSKMCLSCHDGTIALGNILSRRSGIQMSRGVSRLPAGPANLSTDLSDDHPFSFRYDASLASRDPHIVPPGSLPRQLKLDFNGELQCITCHDVHDNSLGDFLVMDNTNAELCISCHQIADTTLTGHNNCMACHQSHTAPSGPYLLRGRTVAQTCLNCHEGGHPLAPNVGPEFNRLYVHDTGSPVEPSGPASEHTSCVDCHDPHTMKGATNRAPDAHASFGSVSGVSASGADVHSARYEYEVCFKCHADDSALQPWIFRQITQNNTRLEFSPDAISYHPVQSPGRNPDVPSLRTGWSSASIMYCSDCHASNTSGASGGSRPGVHGSIYAPLLTNRYDTQNRASESPQAYALCYKCHDRNSLLSDESFPQHSLHIKQTSCSTCHDAHGISSAQGSSTGNTHLMNFDTSVVEPLSNGRMEFVDNGILSGACYIRCHGENHAPASYP